MMNAAYQFLELIPMGRDKAAFRYPMAWLEQYDLYESYRRPGDGE